jgi:hypothetical protein
MHALPEYFEKLLSSIEPSEKRVAAAQDAHGLVRKHLQASDVLPTVAPHSCLAGSYDRHTAINDIKDVDVLVRVPDDYENTTPAEVLQLLTSSLRKLDGVTDVELREQRRSVHVTLAEYDFHLDVVPVVAANGVCRALKVPDKPQQEWVTSNPIGYATMLTDLNQSHGEKAVPLVKMVKQWRDAHMRQRSSRPKSYWLECMLYRLLDDGRITSDGKGWAVLFRDGLSAMCERCRYAYEDSESVPQIEDPATDKIVTVKWERAHFETFLQRLDEALGWADRALEADKADDAIELWRKVFGDQFPAEEQKGEAMAEAVRAGAMVVGPTGRVSVRTSSSGPQVQPRPTRFYGDGSH